MMTIVTTNIRALMPMTPQRRRVTDSPGLCDEQATSGARARLGWKGHQAFWRFASYMTIVETLVLRVQIIVRPLQGSFL
jgi:hypothetical protein